MSNAAELLNMPKPIQALPSSSLVRRPAYHFLWDQALCIGERPWKHIPCDIALPSATQNEIDEEDALALAAGGCKYVAEGANMPSTSEAINIFHKKGIYFGPAKAANAGGVAVSGLEMSQNSIRLQWTREEVDQRLSDIMKSIYTASYEAATEYETTLQAGANIAGFLKVATAMLEQGAV